MSKEKRAGNLKGTWDQAILTFLLPIFLVLVARWAFLEPFVIPSGSMIPNLLIHDHLIVQKFAYGLRVPTTNKWLLQWGQPQRGDVVVFKYPENPDVFYIKRLIGLPGDRVEVRGGRISVNDQAFELSAYENSKNEDGYFYFLENNGQKSYPVRFISDAEGTLQAFVIPEGQYFFMGDNRDESSDSRAWGFVKNDYLVGKAWVIWLSCNSTLPTMTFVCDPAQIRFDRLFTVLK